MKGRIEKMYMHGHANPDQIANQGGPVHLGVQCVKAATTDRRVPEKIDKYGDCEKGKQTHNDNVRRLGTKPGNQKNPANEFCPRHENGHRVDSPIRNDHVCGNGFGELAGIADFVHARVDEESPEIQSENKRQVPMGQHAYDGAEFVIQWSETPDFSIRQGLLGEF